MQILSTVQFSRKIKRMAHEIAERHMRCDSIYIGGISESGRAIAAWLRAEVQGLIPIHIHAFAIDIVQAEGRPPEARYDVSPHDLSGHPVVIVDDVSNTGSTLFYACQPLMQVRPHSIKCAVMVDRTHKSYPIYVDYVGLRLATTLREHISVQCKSGHFEEAAAYLD